MDTKTTLSISQARAKIFDLADQVQKPGRVYTFTDKGVPKAVMLSAEEYESLIETIEVLDQFPNIRKDVEKVDRDVKSGAWRKYASLEDILAKEKLKNKKNKVYALHGKAGKATPKRTR